MNVLYVHVCCKPSQQLPGLWSDAFFLVFSLTTPSLLSLQARSPGSVHKLVHPLYLIGTGAPLPFDGTSTYKSEFVPHPLPQKDTSGVTHYQPLSVPFDGKYITTEKESCPTYLNDLRCVGAC